MGQFTAHVAISAKSKGKGKAKATWPTLVPCIPGVTPMMIGCDHCDCWYHVSCVGLPLDAELDDLPFECPACRLEIAAQGHRNSSRRALEDCTRPGCPHGPRKDEFFVERIVGRRPSTTPGVPLYMIKWEGFGMAECTWQLEHTIPRPERLVAEFEAAAAREGQNVHNMASIFMLQEVLLEPDL